VRAEKWLVCSSSRYIRAIPRRPAQVYGELTETEGVKQMSILQRLSTWALITSAAALLALGFITTALAQADGDGFDGDELGLPIVLGICLLAIVGWMAFRGRARKTPN
jgi:hypothetical protein